MEGISYSVASVQYWSLTQNTSLKTIVKFSDQIIRKYLSKHAGTRGYLDNWNVQINWSMTEAIVIMLAHMTETVRGLWSEVQC